MTLVGAGVDALPLPWERQRARPGVSRASVDEQAPVAGRARYRNQMGEHHADRLGRSLSLRTEAVA